MHRGRCCCAQWGLLRSTALVDLPVENGSFLVLQCLIEAVTIMDIICTQDSSYVYRSLSCLKNLHSWISGDLSYARALLPVAQFFLHHSKDGTLVWPRLRAGAGLWADGACACPVSPSR